MANSSDLEAENLHTLFKRGQELYDSINSSEEPSNSSNYQNQVKEAIDIFENVTNLVSIASIFSKNEEIEELPTNHIKFLLLPSFLGLLSLKLTSRGRKELLDVAEIYFRDFLSRCNDYNLLNHRTKKTEDRKEPSRLKTAIERLVDEANDRKGKIARYRRQKDLKARLQALKSDVNTEDDENKREYFLTMIESSIIEATDELASLQNERPILEHLERAKSEGATWKLSKTAERAPPFRPVIITRDEVQKAVYGAGYPSLPTMTVQEFYDKRVQDGVFPDPNVTAKKSPDDLSMQEAALAGIDSTHRDELEIEKKENLVESDDVDYLKRTRDMDEFKDEHRRGWGNRTNRS